MLTPPRIFAVPEGYGANRGFAALSNRAVLFAVWGGSLPTKRQLEWVGAAMWCWSDPVCAALTNVPP
jgi:hypothetical protein